MGRHRQPRRYELLIVLLAIIGTGIANIMYTDYVFSSLCEMTRVFVDEEVPPTTARAIEIDKALRHFNDTRC